MWQHEPVYDEIWFFRIGVFNNFMRSILEIEIEKAVQTLAS